MSLEVHHLAPLHHLMTRKTICAALSTSNQQYQPPPRRLLITYEEEYNLSKSPTPSIPTLPNQNLDSSAMGGLPPYTSQASEEIYLDHAFLASLTSTPPTSDDEEENSVLAKGPSMCAESEKYAESIKKEKKL